MGSFSGKMEANGTATATDPTAQCCRHGNCCHHGSPLAIQGKQLSLQLKPNNDNRNSAKSVLARDDDRAKIGGLATVRCFSEHNASFFSFISLFLERCLIVPCFAILLLFFMPLGVKAQELKNKV